MPRSPLLESPETIQGIGEVYSARLGELGLTSLTDLLRASAGWVAGYLGVDPERVEAWQAQAILLRLDETDPDIAEALVDAGLDSTTAVADAALSTLEGAMADAVEAGRLAEAPSTSRLSTLHRDATAKKGTGVVAGSVTHDDDQPAAEVVVSCGGTWTRTDEDGVFVLDAVPTGSHRLSVTAEGRPNANLQISTASDEVAVSLAIRVQRTPGNPAPSHDEHQGVLVRIARGAELRLETVQLDELPADTYVMVRNIAGHGSTRLIELYKTQTGGDIVVRRVYVDQRELPEGSKVGVILKRVAGAFEVTELSVEDVARQKLEAILGPLTLERSATRQVSALSLNQA